jgi:hypothetical protein
MIPIVADSIPASTDALAAALRRGFESRGLTPREITALGSNYPELASLSIDLTDAHFTRESRTTVAEGNDGNPLQIARFALFGEPVYFERTPLAVRIEAEDVQMRVTGEAQNGSLKLETATAGTVAVQVTLEALEALLQSVASEAAAQKGIEVKKTKLTLTQEGPRAVSFRAEVTAKVFIMSASLALTGRLEIDDAFNARLSALALDGDAMVTNLAGSFLRPRLQELEGKVFPLLALSPGGLKLRDIEVSVTPDLQLRARFGGAE